MQEVQNMRYMEAILKFSVENAGIDFQACLPGNGTNSSGEEIDFLFVIMNSGLWVIRWTKRLRFWIKAMNAKTEVSWIRKFLLSWKLYHLKKIKLAVYLNTSRISL